jgi:hypothetical protein
MEAIKEILSSPSKWTIAPHESVYSCDQVIDAYLKGKSDGVQQTQKLIAKQLDDNIKKTLVQTDRLVSHILSIGFHPQAAYMRIDGWDAFTILVTLPDDEWCDERFLEVFAYVCESEEILSGDFYSLETLFCGVPSSGSLDEESVTLDGFIFKMNIP